MSQQSEGASPAPAEALSQAGLWLRAFQAICFVAGGLSHARDMWHGGWLPYGWAPLPLNLFWTSLLAWDLLAAGLLLWRPRAGVVLALLIMVADVVVNSFWTASVGPLGWEENLPLQLQTLFLGFVAGAAPLIWLAAADVDSAATGRAASGTGHARSATAGSEAGG
jgi:hypothetical protein